MGTPIDVIEQALVDEFAGRIDRQEAIRRIRAVLDVTERGAADILDHPIAARARYAGANHSPLDLAWYQRGAGSVSTENLPPRIRIAPDVDLDHPDTSKMIRYCLDDPEQREWFIGRCGEAERVPWWRRLLRALLLKRED